MKRCRLGLAVVVLVLLGAQAPTSDPPPLLTASGAVDKVDNDTLTLKQRGPDGRFGKNLVLKVTGTSKVTTLLPQTRKGSLVLTQRDTEVKDLQPKQSIAMVYTLMNDSPVLLTAVAQPPAAK
jgi:hypothetical protein